MHTRTLDMEGGCTSNGPLGRYALSFEEKPSSKEAGKDGSCVPHNYPFDTTDYTFRREQQQITYPRHSSHCRISNMSSLRVTFILSLVIFAE